MPAIDWITNLFGEVIVKYLNKGSDAFFSFLGIVSDIVSGLLTLLGGVIEFLAGVFTRDWNTRGTEFQRLFKGLGRFDADDQRCPQCWYFPCEQVY